MAVIPRSPESKFDSDIREINESGIERVLQDVETAYLSDSFWDAGLIQCLTTAGSRAPALHVFWAAHGKCNDKGILSRNISVKEMIEHLGDIHHIFPRQYLKENGFSQSQYNQVANCVYVQQEINIKFGKRSPADYIGQIREQCQSRKLAFGGIDTLSDFVANLGANCIPGTIYQMTLEDYEVFLGVRRALMAQKIKRYYQNL